MNFLRIAWRDISGIFKNKFIRVSVVAIIIVPLLYSLLYLDAFWDPYSRLDKMHVAVVNMDKGSTDEGKDVNYGNQIVDNIKTNKKVGWEFVSLDDAKKGLIGTKYYAMFVIPENFSENVLSAKTGSPVKAQMIYTSNAKKNFIASQIDNNIEVQLQQEITKNISKEYSKVTFDNLYDVKDGFKAASDGSGQLKDGITAASDGAKQINDGMNKLNSNVPALQSGVKALCNGSASLYNGLGLLKNGTSQLQQGIGTLNSNVPELSNGVGRLTSGAGSLSSGLLSAKKGSWTIYDAITTNAKDANGNPVGLKAGVTSLSDGLHKLNDGVNGSTGLKMGMISLNSGLHDLSGKIDASDGLKAGTTALSSGVNQLNYYFTTTETQKDQYGNIVPKGINAGAEAVDAGVNKLIETQQKIAYDLQDYLKNPTGPNAAHDISEITTIINDKKNAQEIAALKSGADNLKNGIEQVSQQFSTDYDKKGQPTVKGASTALSDGASQISNVLDTQIVPGSQTLTDGVNAVATGIDNADNGSKQLLGGTNDLADGMYKLSTGIGAASDGADQLSGGLNQLNSSVPALANGVTALSSGADKLMNTGVMPLYNGAGQLTNGLQQLDSNVPALAGGISKLADGSNQLYSGMGKLSDGSNELYTKLKDGSDKINSNLKNDSNTMGEFISEPLTMKASPINDVKNYGTGFTGYFIPLSLWVGAIMMFFIISDKVDSDIQASPASIVLGKFLSYGYIGVIQAVLASLIVLTLGLHPKNLILYILFNVFMSYVFIAIIQALIFLLGNAGRLLSIVLLILQLTSCGGTFPMELVPKFFQVLNPFMPFTYCVSALRELISGVDYAVVGKDVLVLACMMFGFLFISVLFKGHADKVQERIKSQMTDQM